MTVWLLFNVRLTIFQL